jgi:hypothetical protein
MGRGATLATMRLEKVRHDFCSIDIDMLMGKIKMLKKVL